MKLYSAYQMMAKMGLNLHSGVNGVQEVVNQGRVWPSQ